MKRLTVSICLLLSLSAAAQQAPTFSTSDNGNLVPPGGTVEGRWAQAKDELTSGSKIYVVSLDRRKKRSTCRVASVSEQKLVCEADALGQMKVYAREQVAAMILPASHTARPWVLGFLAGGGGMIAAACLAPITLGASIPMMILGSAMILSTGAMEIGDNESRSEEFIYRRPGIDLSSVRLRN